MNEPETLNVSYRYVLQWSYQDGPWTDEHRGWPDQAYAELCYRGRVELNREPEMKFRLIRRETTITETDITPPLKSSGA